MTKPAITKRSVKGAALTYNELDTNFQNLQDATVSITAGSGGTQVTSDLNGNITLVAGTGVSLSGDNTAKTITITSTTTGGVTNPLSADLDLGNYLIKDTNSAITLKSTQGLVVQSNTYSSNSKITFSPGTDDAAASARIESGPSRDLFINTSSTLGVVQSIITLDDSGKLISLSSSSQTNDFYVLFGTAGIGVTRHYPITTSQRDALVTVLDGMIIYNSTTGKFQGRAAGSWVDLH